MQGGFGGICRDERARREEGSPGAGREAKRSASPQDALPAQHKAG